MEPTQLSHEADGQEEWGKHVQAPEGEVVAAAERQCGPPGPWAKPAWDERWGCSHEPAPDLTGPHRPCQGLALDPEDRGLCKLQAQDLTCPSRSFFQM